MTMNRSHLKLDPRPSKNGGVVNRWVKQDDGSATRGASIPAPVGMLTTSPQKERFQRAVEKTDPVNTHVFAEAADRYSEETIGMAADLVEEVGIEGLRTISTLFFLEGNYPEELVQHVIKNADLVRMYYKSKLEEFGLAASPSAKQRAQQSIEAVSQAIQGCAMYLGDRSDRTPDDEKYHEMFGSNYDPLEFRAAIFAASFDLRLIGYPLLAAGGWICAETPDQHADILQRVVPHVDTLTRNYECAFKVARKYYKCNLPTEVENLVEACRLYEEAGVDIEVITDAIEQRGRGALAHLDQVVKSDLVSSLYDGML
jgi:hypothetical protein